jgi:hypothetical protein
MNPMLVRDPERLGNLDPPLGRLYEAGDQPQDGRLAATARPDDRKELALIKHEVDIVQHLPASVVGHRHMRQDRGRRT